MKLSEAFWEGFWDGVTFGPLWRFFRTGWRVLKRKWTAT